MARKKTNIKDRLMSHVGVNNDTGCWEWTAHRNNYGYGMIGVNGHTMTAHRVSFSIFKGPIPDGHVVMHACDNPKCINPEHLSTGTRSDNMKDCRDKSRLVVPSMSHDSHWNSRLTEEDVHAIRKSALSNRELSTSYNVSISTIWKIRKGLLWRDAS